MKYFYYISFICLLICSCKKSNKYTNPLQSAIHIPVKMGDDILKLSKIGASIKCIPLSNDFLLRDVRKLLLDEKNNFYILDSRGNGIFKFNSQGEFIKQISRKGNGPGEYTKIYDFDIDKNNVILLSETLLYYDLEGKFLFNKKLPTGCNSFSIHNGKIIGSLGAQSVMIFKDDTFEEYKSRTKEKYFSFSHPYHFTKNENKIFYEDCYNDTIYEIIPNGINPFLIVDFGDLKLPKDIPITNDILNNTEVNRYCSDISFFRISNNYISFAFNHAYRVKVCIYNQDTKESNVFGRILNDLNYIPISMPIPLIIKDKKLYFVTEGGWIYNQYIALKQSKKIEDNNIANNMKNILGKEPTEMDNPTLIEVTFK